MVTFIINVLLSFMTCFVSPNNNHEYIEIKYKELKRLDLSKDSIMGSILEEVTDRVRNGGRSAYYTVSIKGYQDGYLIKFQRSNQDIFESREHPFAYTEVNNSILVFNNTNEYHVVYSSTDQPIKIKTATLDERTDIKATIFYYVLGNIYARFSPEVGWIWSDGKPDEYYVLPLLHPGLSRKQPGSHQRLDRYDRAGDSLLPLRRSHSRPWQHNHGAALQVRRQGTPDCQRPQ